ncbi:MAG: hypothetical protein DI551_04330 [Micavibrio aeruginosavorus]|uniref:YgjV family protein n=1 Tax=Micavibrio aeruginosavorus TaxID=349221 RepID=A0A2W5PWT2_9BACT|nr:MAG: hypothetical protein DI551_04330 [Micavibrio aeruginosavorus]
MQEYLSVAQISGYIALVIYIAAYAFKSDNVMKVTFSISNVLWVVHYYLIGAHTAALTTLIITLRNVLSLNSDNLPEHKKKVMAAIFAVILLIAGIITWAGLVSIIPVSATIAATYMMFYLKGVKLRQAFWVLDAGWLLHAILVGSVSGGIYAVGSLLVNGYTIVKMMREEKDSGADASIT